MGDVAQSPPSDDRSFNRFKQWRGLATRYDKYPVTYLGGVLPVLIVLTHRAQR
jgi:transposase